MNRRQFLALLAGSLGSGCASQRPSISSQTDTPTPTPEAHDREANDLPVANTDDGEHSVSIRVLKDGNEVYAWEQTVEPHSRTVLTDIVEHGVYTVEFSVDGRTTTKEWRAKSCYRHEIVINESGAAKLDGRVC